MKHRLIQAAVAVVNMIGLYVVSTFPFLSIVAPNRDIRYNTTPSTVAKAISTSRATTLNDISVAGSRIRQNGTIGSRSPVTTFNWKERERKVNCILLAI